MRRRSWLLVLGICLADVIVCFLTVGAGIFFLSGLLVEFSLVFTIIFMVSALAKNSGRKFDLRKRINSSGSSTYFASPREANRTPREIILRGIIPASYRAWQGANIIGARAEIAQSVGSRRHRQDDDYSQV